LSPDSYTARYFLGHALWMTGDLDGAIAASREATRFSRGEPRAWSQLVEVLAEARRYEDVLATTGAAWQQHPLLRESPSSAFRYHAARAAVQCAAGRGPKAPPAPEPPAYRKQAITLLTAELAALPKIVARDRAFVHQRLGDWLTAKELAPVREPAGVAQLPSEERDVWTKLWAEVRDLHDRTAPAAGSLKVVK
jgi:hypothetical protein